MSEKTPAGRSLNAIKSFISQLEWAYITCMITKEKVNMQTEKQMGSERNLNFLS